MSIAVTIYMQGKLMHPTDMLRSASVCLNTHSEPVRYYLVINFAVPRIHPFRT